MVVKEHTCEAHRAIASALSSRDTEIREVLEGLRASDGCWCSGEFEYADVAIHSAVCEAARALWAKLQLKEASDVIE